LRTSSPGLTHGEVFRYVERGLNAEQIASIRDTTNVYYVKDVLSSLNHLFERHAAHKPVGGAHELPGL